MGCLGGEDGESDIRAEGIRNGFGGECSELSIRGVMEISGCCW